MLLWETWSFQIITCISVTPYCVASHRGILVYVGAISKEGDARRCLLMPGFFHVVNNMVVSVRMFDIY